MTEFLLAAGSALWLGVLTSISPCPLATNIAAISYIGRRVDSTRYVLLAGLLYTPVGLMATVGVRLNGAGLIIGVESMPNRIALAMKYGCDVVVNFAKEDPVLAIMKLTGGKGVDSSIEALSSAQTFAACVSVARPGGTILTSAIMAMATAY